MAMRGKLGLLAVAGAATLGLAASSAEAAFQAQNPSIATGSAQCSGGTEGGETSDCFVQIGDLKSPIIAKYENDSTNGGFVLEAVSLGNFSTIDGSEFTFTNLEVATDPKKGTWTYTPGPGDPFVVAYGVKFGTQSEVFVWSGTGSGGFSDSWDLSNGLSSISFYDTGVVPLPAAAWMMIGGLGIVGGLVSRRRRAAAAAA